MKKHLILLILTMAMVSGMAGCGREPDSGLQNQTIPSNIELPDASTAPPTSEMNVPDSYASDDGIGYGYTDEFIETSFSDGLVYKGGEFKVSLFFDFPLDLQREGYQVYFFLDGKPQPYAMTPGGELKYAHFLQDKPMLHGGVPERDFYITPVTGEKGDSLEFTFMIFKAPQYTLNYPELSPATISHAFPILVIRSSPMVFEETPPQQEVPTVKDRIISTEMNYQDLTAKETAGWTDEDYVSEVHKFVTVDGYDSSGISFGITPDHAVPVHFEVMGAPAAQFSLLIYVDGEPASTNPEDEIILQPKNGQKAIADVMIDFSDFDGESQIFLCLIPKNITIANLGGSCEPQYYHGYWFVDDPQPSDYARPIEGKRS